MANVYFRTIPWSVVHYKIGLQAGLQNLYIMVSCIRLL